MNADDLLSFKEYSPVHGTHTSGGSAEININSPNRQRSPYQNATTTSNQSTLNDPINDLINSMSASVNILQNEDRQRSPSSNNLKPFPFPSYHMKFNLIPFVPFRWFGRKPTNQSLNFFHWILSTIFQCWCKHCIWTHRISNHSTACTRSVY